MPDIFLRAGEEVVKADHVMAVVQEPFAEVGSDEAAAACYENGFASQGLFLRWRFVLV